jgi:hypothetical protein
MDLILQNVPPSKNGSIAFCKVNHLYVGINGMTPTTFPSLNTIIFVPQIKTILHD